MSETKDLKKQLSKHIAGKIFKHLTETRKKNLEKFLTEEVKEVKEVKESKDVKESKEEKKPIDAVPKKNVMRQYLDNIEEIMRSHKFCSGKEFSLVNLEFLQVYHKMKLPLDDLIILKTYYNLKPPKLPENMKEFNKRAKRVLGCLADFPYFDKFVLAGGAVGSILYNDSNDWGSDIDLFPVNIDNKELVFILGELVKRLESHAKEIGATLYANQVENCYTFQMMKDYLPILGCGKVQVIAKTFSTISDVIYDFDLGSCAVAYNGKEVYFAPSAVFAYTHFLNFVSFSNYRYTYNRRIKKYFDRGFGIVLRDADEEKYDSEVKLFTNSWLKLDTMQFHLSKSAGKNIYISSCHTNEDTPISEENYYGVGNVYGNAEGISRYNVDNYIRGWKGRFVSFTTVPSYCVEHFDEPKTPYFSSMGKMVENCLGREIKVEKMTKMFGPTATAEIIAIFTNGGFNKNVLDYDQIGFEFQKLMEEQCERESDIKIKTTHPKANGDFRTPEEMEVLKKKWYKKLV